MVQSRRGASFALESLQGLLIACQVVWQELQSHEPPQARVFRFVNNTHPATAESLQDSIVRDGLANHLEGMFLRAILGCGPEQVNDTTQR
jgi:hypothetical protein